MADGLSYEERAAEITGRIMVAMVSPGGNSPYSWEFGRAKEYGAGAGAAFREVYQSVLSSLKSR